MNTIPHSIRRARNCYALTCVKCRKFGLRKGGKYIRGKGFVCAECARKVA